MKLWFPKPQQRLTWQTSGSDSMLPMQAAWVLYLASKLRSWMPHCAAKKIKESKSRLPTKKNPWPEVFTDELYQTFRENLKLVLLKLCQKTAEKRITPISFCETTSAVIAKQDKNITENKITGQYQWWKYIHTHK